MSTTTKTDTDTLKQNLRAARARQQYLAQEMRDLPVKIREAMGQAAAQRAEAARRGDSTATVAAELDVQALRERQDDLPLEHWAQQVAVAELQRDLYAAELQEAVAEQQRTGPAFTKAQQEADEAAKRRDEAWAKASAAGSRAQSLRIKLRDASKQIKQLEGDYPGA